MCIRDSMERIKRRKAQGLQDRYLYDYTFANDLSLIHIYHLMGIEVGTTVHFPMTTQELQAALAKIGIDGKRYSEVFFTSFDSDVLGLYDHLYECENIDELNELGHALLEVQMCIRDRL